ncbi:Alpha-ketoglutarate-dependent taurine dioxygenase [Hypsizygus marmoreus]|uniref:Alpha-ketoglutarate-dependent taurine dioxygenase n=1 Tax=Hypsizygus marmoreus TaxID=39966 RepID=A0A369JIU2_HYPMA|nr:Alpha-ketoglutarate-dependent taurine dioxygenase [Hypsizygus marmoreus]
MVNAPPSFLGSLSAFESYDNTTQIGTTFPDKSVQLSKLLNAPNSDELIKDLATLVSHRGVVFFTDQDLQIGQQKELGRRLGKLTGNPESSGLHVHPVSEDLPELGADVSVISSKGGIARPEARLTSTRASRGWHADITFEPVPSDYAILKMHTIPEVGGDTLWASGYEAYDRLSPAYQRFLEGLTAVHNADTFIEYVQRNGLKMNDNRGSPENTGTSLTTIHPVIRTNPVTGFKALFVNREFTKRIVELSPEESDDVLRFLQLHISENHDFQVRYRWRKNDIAIWDNRSTFHTATTDYGDVLRQGNRVVSIGEKPYFDPKSKSRRAVLGVPFNVVPEL